MDLAIRSLIFTYYNRARFKAAFQEDRLHKALGIILSGKLQEKIKKYGTRTDDCYCPDRQERHMICKHMIAVWIMQKVYTHVQKIFINEINHRLW